MAVKQTMGAAEWGMLVALSMLWGGSFFFVAIAVKELPPFTIVALRVGTAALVLHVVIRAMGLSIPKDRKVWSAFFGMGLLNNLIPFSLIAWGQTQIAGGLASILNATTPRFIVIVAHFFTRDEKMTGNKLIGVLVGFFGVAVMIGPAALSGLGLSVWAQVAILCASISYAFSGIFGRRFRELGVQPLATATGQLTASTVMLVPVALLVDQPWTLAMPHIETWEAIIGLSLLSTALAYNLFFRILASAGATNISLVTFLVPVSAILLSALFLGEQLEAKHFIGMTLIGVGLAAIDGRLLALIKPSS